MLAASLAGTESPPPLESVWERLGRALSPIEARPRVVHGIEAAHFTTRTGKPYVVVHNPAAHTYLKLDPAEFDLLPQMDGTQSVKTLTVAYYQRNGVLALPRISQLVRLLHENRFLNEPPRNTYSELLTHLRGRDIAAWLVRLGRAFLNTELALRGADGFLGALYRAWGWLFFTRPVVVVGTVLGLVAPLVFFLEMQRGRYVLFQAGGSYAAGFAVLLVLSLVTLAVHELGHGLAVKHAGRAVDRAGLMLYYGLPAAFVDTTDVWMAPRRQRLVASFAGPWTGLVLGSGCAVGAFLLPESVVGELLFAWGFVFLLDNLLNFNPLLELDGYYMLVDVLDKPMLRARALAFVRGPLWAKLRRRQPLSGEERMFAFFGLASAAWSLLAIGLAIRFWELRLLPLVQEAWSSEQLLPRVLVVLLACAVAVPLALGAWQFAARASLALARRMAWLQTKTAVRRHRQAIEALRSVPLWAALPEPRLLEIAHLMRLERVAPGTEVVRQGEPGDRFYVIGDGVFEVLVSGEPVARLGRGDYFGERALLHEAPRAATVVALEPSTVFSLNQQSFHASLAGDLATRQRLEAALAYREQVADIGLFRELSPSEMDLLLTRLVPETAAAGEEVVRQGDPGDRFYVVRSGRVEVVRDGQVLAQLGPGVAFGEIALLLNVPRTATVRALEPTELLTLSANDFRDLLVGYLGRAQDLQRLSHLRMQDHLSRSAPTG